MMNPLYTMRLVLRNFSEEDLLDLYEYLSDPDVVKFEPYRPMTLGETRKDLARRVRTDEMITVQTKGTRKVIGNLYLARRDPDSLELGYVFNKSFWGKGYAKESALALIDRAFAEGAQKIYAHCDPDNPASWKLLESLGFQREALLKQNVSFWKDADGEPIWKDTLVYSLLSSCR